jgi:hypothetical protein
MRSRDSCRSLNRLLNASLDTPDVSTEVFISVYLSTIARNAEMSDF